MQSDFPSPGYERIEPVEVPGENLLVVAAPRATARTSCLS